MTCDNLATKADIEQLSSKIDSLQSSIEALSEALQTIQSAVNSVNDTINTAINSLTDIITNSMSNITDTINNGINSITGIINSAINGLVSVLTSLITSLLGGNNNNDCLTYDQATQIQDNIISAIITQSIIVIDTLSALIKAINLDLSPITNQITSIKLEILNAIANINLDLSPVINLINSVSTNIITAIANINLDLSPVLNAIANILMYIQNNFNLDLSPILSAINNINFNPNIDVSFNGTIDNNIEFNPSVSFNGTVEFNGTIDNQINFNPIVNVPDIIFNPIIDNNIEFNPNIDVNIQGILNAIANLEANLELSINPQFTAVLNAIAGILAYLQANLNIDLSAEIQLILQAIANINFDADFQLIIDTVNNKDCGDNNNQLPCELEYETTNINLFTQCPETENDVYYTNQSLTVLKGLSSQQVFLFNQLLEIRKTLCDLNYEFSIPYQQKRVYPKDIYLSIDWFVDNHNSKTRYPDRQVLEPDLTLNWDNIWLDMMNNLTWESGQIHATVPTKNYDTPIVSGYFKDRNEASKVLGYLRNLSTLEVVASDNWLRVNDGASKRTISSNITKPFKLTCYSISQDKILFQYKRTKLNAQGWIKL